MKASALMSALAEAINDLPVSKRTQANDLRHVDAVQEIGMDRAFTVMMVAPGIVRPPEESASCRRRFITLEITVGHMIAPGVAGRAADDAYLINNLFYSIGQAIRWVRLAGEPSYMADADTLDGVLMSTFTVTLDYTED